MCNSATGRISVAPSSRDAAFADAVAAADANLALARANREWEREHPRQHSGMADLRRAVLARLREYYDDEGRLRPRRPDGRPHKYFRFHTVLILHEHMPAAFSASFASEVVEQCLFAERRRARPRTQPVFDADGCVVKWARPTPAPGRMTSLIDHGLRALRRIARAERACAAALAPAAPPWLPPSRAEAPVETTLACGGGDPARPVRFAVRARAWSLEPIMTEAIQALQQVCNAIPEYCYTADNDRREEEEHCNLFDMLHGLAVCTKANARSRGAEKAITRAQKRRRIALIACRWRRRIAEVERGAYMLMAACSDAANKLARIAGRVGLTPRQARDLWYEEWKRRPQHRMHFQHGEEDARLKCEGLRALEEHCRGRSGWTSSGYPVDSIESNRKISIVSDEVSESVFESLGVRPSPHKHLETAVQDYLHELRTDVVGFMEGYGKHNSRRAALAYCDRVRGASTTFCTLINTFLRCWHDARNEAERTLPIYDALAREALKRACESDERLDDFARRTSARRFHNPDANDGPLPGQQRSESEEMVDEFEHNCLRDLKEAYANKPESLKKKTGRGVFHYPSGQHRNQNPNFHGASHRTDEWWKKLQERNKHAEVAIAADLNVKKALKRFQAFEGEALSFAREVERLGARVAQARSVCFEWEGPNLSADEAERRAAAEANTRVCAAFLSEGA